MAAAAEACISTVAHILAAVRISAVADTLAAAPISTVAHTLAAARISAAPARAVTTLAVHVSAVRVLAASAWAVGISAAHISAHISGAYGLAGRTSVASTTIASLDCDSDTADGSLDYDSATADVSLDRATTTGPITTTTIVAGCTGAYGPDGAGVGAGSIAAATTAIGATGGITKLRRRPRCLLKEENPGRKNGRGSTPGD